MIDKGLYRQNFSVGGRDGPASGDAPGPGDTGGEGGYGRDTNQFGAQGSSPTSTGGITDIDRNRVKQQILNQK